MWRAESRAGVITVPADHKTSRIVIQATIIVVALVALYLIGFVVAVKLGPGLTPPVTSVLDVVYWPLIWCDRNNVEPFKTVIRWLRFR